MSQRILLCAVMMLSPLILLGQDLPESGPASAPTTSAPVLTPTSEPVMAPTLTPVLLSGACGDGALNLNEQCDDGNIMNGDGCSIICVVEGCGDNALQGGRGEQCDDGNTSDGDGCSASCTLEKSYRSPTTATLLGAAVTLAGFPLNRLTRSIIPSLISFGVGPMLGRIYMRDYKRGALYTGLRAASLGAAFTGLAVMGANFRFENVGNGVPLDAFPGDGSVLLGGVIFFGGSALYPTIAVIDLADLWAQGGQGPRAFALRPTPMSFGRGSFGGGLQLSF